MTQNIDVIIKLGGSAVTDKNKLETVNHDNLGHAASLIRKCVKAGLTCVIVHGAGSFGHHQAKHYSVNGGYTSSQAQISHVKTGFCKTRLSVLKLNQLVVGALIDKEVNAVSQNPCGRWVTKSGDVIRDDVPALMELIRARFVPVIHGDCVMDEDQGCRILSGDTIIKVICEKSSCQRVVFLTDVEGIYNKPPEINDSQLIPEITVSENGKISTNITTTSNEHDVTGGVLLKICTAVDIVKFTNGVTPVFICKLGSAAAEAACLRGNIDKLSGTKITKNIVYDPTNLRIS